MARAARKRPANRPGRPAEHGTAAGSGVRSGAGHMIHHDSEEPVEPKPATTRHEPPPPIGPRLKQYRLRENLTLADLQKLTGISKSMLSQIERGAVNPTFARVWHLTKSLGIGVGELLGEVKQTVDKVGEYQHLKDYATPVIASADGLCTTRILSPIRRTLPVEWYEVILQPGGSLRANAHGNGAWEHQTVLSGQIVVEIGDKEVTLGPGDTVRYSAEQPHGARNDSDSEARVLLVALALKELDVSV